jgi:hypothetical protein
VKSTQCKGKVEEPTAEPGNLCVYAETIVNTEVLSEEINPPGVEAPGFEEAGTGRAGAVIHVIVGVGGEKAWGWGSWAVTAE